MSNIKIFETSKISKKKRTIVTGFSGYGFIGNTALMHIVKAKSFTQVAYLEGNSLPPLMVILEGKPMHSFRIYTDPSDMLMFLVTEATISGKSAWDIGQAIISWLKEKGISEILTIEGFPFTHPSENLFGFTTGDKNLHEYNIQPLSQGAVSGVNAALLDKIMGEGISWTTLFVPTQVVSGIDYKSVISSIHVLSNILNLEIDTGPLEKLVEYETNTVKARQSKNVQKKGSFFDRFITG